MARPAFDRGAPAGPPGRASARIEIGALLSEAPDITRSADVAEKLAKAVENGENKSLLPVLVPTPPYRPKRDAPKLIAVGEIHEFSIKANTKDLTEVEIIYEWHLPQTLFSHVPGDCRIVRITTDGLKPIIDTNDYLIVDISQKQVWGMRGYYIFTEGHIAPLLRRIAPAGAVENGHTRLRIFAANRDVEERMIEESAITILGRVIGKLTMWL